MPTGLLDYVGPFLHRFREVRFDLLHGVRTGGRERLETLDLATANDIQKRRYEGIDPKLFNRILKNLGIDYSKFVFIDLGSGKGRAVMLASMFPFRKSHWAGVFEDSLGDLDGKPPQVSNPATESRAGRNRADRRRVIPASE
jgi:hypothetical protein